MKAAYIILLLLVLAFFPACKQTARQPAQPAAASPTPATSKTETPKSPHANQVPVLLGKTSPEAAKLNPRIAEAYSPEKVQLQRAAAAPAGFPDAREAQNESAPPGMKWLIVIVETGAAEGEVSLALSKIRIVDQAKRPYRLVSFGGSDAGLFTDFREYDKYKMVEPPKLIMKSPVAGKQDFLFAVAAKAEGLSLEF